MEVTSLQRDRTTVEMEKIFGISLGEFKRKTRKFKKRKEMGGREGRDWGGEVAPFSIPTIN